MSNFIYFLGLFLFSRAFPFALLAVAFFSLAVESRKHPDNPLYQPPRFYALLGGMFASAAVMEAGKLFPALKPVVFVCKTVFLGLSAYLLWLLIPAWWKAHQEKKNSTKHPS